MPTLQEPTWKREGQKVFTPLSSLCSTGIRPSIVTGILIRLIQAHFYDVDNIENEKLKTYTWDPDIEQSRLLIKPTYKYDPVTANNRAAIYVEAGDMKTEEYAINNMSTPHLEPNGNFEGILRTIILSGTHEIRCVASECMEATCLGEEVFFRLLEYYPIIRNDLKFSDFKVIVLTRPQQLKESDDHYTCTVRVVWKYAHSWKLDTLAPILKRLSTGVLFSSKDKC